MDAEMKALIAERAQIKAALTRFGKYFDSVDDSTPVDVIESRLEKGVELLDRFESCQDKIEFLSNPNDAEEVTKNDDERVRFEGVYHLLITKVKRHISSKRPPAGDASMSQSSANSRLTPVSGEPQIDIRLPTIDLPKFNGERDKWVRFRESFESMIHYNDSLTKLRKFHYLNSAISGLAARAIRSLAISEANYLTAWQTLKRRYEDSNALLDHHTKALFELPVVTKASHIALRQLIDDATNHLAALNALGEPTDSWSTLLLRLISSKLDHSTRTEWKRHAQTISGKRKFDDLVNFIERHCCLLEDSVSDSRPQQAKSSNNSNGNSFNKRSSNTTSLVVNLNSDCPLCKANHRLADCEEFTNLSVSSRRSKALKLRVCFNCLLLGHTNRECKKSLCRKCGKNHHTLVHLDYNKSSASERPSTSSSPTPVSDIPIECPQALLSHSSATHQQAVLLSTAIIHICDKRGKKHECQALLDQGSQANFITEALARKLDLPMEVINASISGIGRTSHAIRGRVEATISSRINAFKKYIACLVIPKISESVLNFRLNQSAIPIPEKFALADQQFGITREVDLLIGNSLLWDLICIGQHRLGHGYPLIQKTQLGWILAGELNSSIIASHQNFSCHLVTSNKPDYDLQKFWEIEELSSPTSNLPMLDPSDPCEVHFSKTTVRDPDGVFTVSIPFTSELSELGESRRNAEKRFYALERKFEKLPGVKQEYLKFMTKYEDLGHMSEVPNELIRDGEPVYYLPHHAVFKLSSTTTKLRVVFDGSAKTSSGISLNQTQRVGPIVQDDLFSIVLRLRKNKYVISADVAKMYRQVRIQPSQRRFQRILWRPHPFESIKVYELNTVTYGTASASYLSTRVLRQLGEDSLVDQPAAGRAIIRDFYVDDLLTGADTLEEAQHLQVTIPRILRTAGFELRKWASNDSRIINQASPRDRIPIDADKDPKTLGLLWNLTEDCLRYSVPPPSQHKITKRTILSEIARIFDPLGLVGPAIIEAKILMQKLWELKSQWDESLPLHLHTHWENFRRELVALNELKIPRHALISNASQFQLHGFCDASERAYGASIYLRSQDDQGDITCHLLCAKSKVAPLKTISLPRLELCGALLLSKLAAKVRSALASEIQSEYYWTDSTITLAWIQASPARWRTFVANRVTKIQERAHGRWQHVSSQDNPADLISWGINPSLLAASSIWWHGPSWLIEDSMCWPNHSTEIEESQIPEQKTSAVAMIALTSPNFTIFERYSSVGKLFRVVAYCFRFYYSLRTRVHRRNIKDDAETSPAPPCIGLPYVTADELINSEHALLRLVQRHHFAEEITQLTNGRQISRKSPLLSLFSFLDRFGLLRVGGRLNNAPIPYQQQHPAICPQNIH